MTEHHAAIDILKLDLKKDLILCKINRHKKDPNLFLTSIVKSQNLVLYNLGKNWRKKYIKVLPICTIFMPLRRRVGGGGILIYPLSVCPSWYSYMVCLAISSYSFGATALIFCRMFIHIMEVCMSTGFWFSSNILKMTGSWTWVIFFVLAA
jgi:hypothetical protein